VLEVVIAEKNEEITGLKKHISELESQLQALRQFEPSTKIDIRDKYLPTIRRNPYLIRVFAISFIRIASSVSSRRWRL
jgi:hypothetical protein